MSDLFTSMPRNLIKKYLPKPSQIKDNKFLKVFGPVIHEPMLWHLTRRSVAKAFIVGLFFAFWPVPFQMVLAAAGAIVLRANLPLSVALVWITNPVTMPFLFGIAYFVGIFALGESGNGFEFELSWQWLETNLTSLWQPLLLGCAICGVVAATTGYLFINLFWKWHVMNAWKNRRNRSVVN